MAILKLDPAKQLRDLATIAKQLEAAKDVNRETRQLSQMWDKMAERLAEAHDATEGVYAEVPKTGLLDGAEAARKVAQALNPIAEVSWSQDELTNLIEDVRYAMARGGYEGEQLVEANETLTKVAALTRSRKGGSRGPGQTIEGRPEKVRVLDADGQEIATQKGNGPSSVGNLTAAIVKYLQGNGVDVTETVKTAIQESVKSCVMEGNKAVTVGDFATLVHVA